MNKVSDFESLIEQPTQQKTGRFSGFNRYFFAWVFSLVKLGRRAPLTQKDLFYISEQDSSRKSFELFTRKLQKYRNIQLALFFSFWRIILQAFILYFLCVTLSAFMPYFMDKAQQFFKEDQRNDQYSAMISFAFVQMIYFLSMSILQPYMQYQTTVLSVRIQGALQHAIFAKTLKFPISRSKNYNSGDLINMLQVDIIQASAIFTNQFQVYLVPFQLCVTAVVFYKTVGDNSIIPGIGALIQALFGIVFGYLYGRIQGKFMHAKDERMSRVDEALFYVKQIKLNCLEEYFDNKINKLRIRELRYLKYQIAMLLFVQFFQNISNLGCWEILFLMIDSINFDTITLMMQNFSGIVTLLSNLPIQLKSYYMSKNSISRITKYVRLPDIDQLAIQNEDADLAIQISDGQFSWKKVEEQSNPEAENLFMMNISLEVKKGQFVAIVGSSASGKSTILKSLLQETLFLEGRVIINGKISLATQEPWILSDTIRQNVTYMEEFDLERYQEVIRVCALDQDIQRFQYGDQTVLGEKGDNLSGGQQKRINLARAVYRNADIYLLDDPLSALDIKVKCHIFEECLQGFLRDKTVVYFTNSFAHLKHVETVYRLNEKGELERFQSNNVQQVEPLQKETQEENLNKQFEEVHYPPLKVSEADQEAKCNIIVAEDQETGSIKRDVLTEIFKFQGRWWSVVVLIAYFFILTGFQVFGNMQLTTPNISDEVFRDLAILYYPFIYIPMFFAYLLVTSYFLLRGLKTSKLIHKNVFFRLMRASVTRFYNTILIGRLMNRLSKDIYNIDLLFPNQLSTFVIQFVAILLPIINSVIFLNLIIVPVLLLFMCLLIYITKIYYKNLREVTRIESVSKSPVFAYYQQIIRGLSYARVSLPEGKLVQVHQKNVDLDLGNQLNLVGLQQWFAQFSGIITNFFQTFLFVLCYLFPGDTQKMTYLILLQISNVSALLVTTASSYGLLLQYSVSFERCLHLAKYKIEAEDYESQDALLEITHNSSDVIQFDKSEFSYRKNSKKVLKNLILGVRQGEKIGVVGRTGAGKSSMILALTRMLEKISGQLKINGKCQEAFRLHDLRKAFSIIPQDPLIFQGTLKQNLDPLDQYAKSVIDDVCDVCGLFQMDVFKRRLESEIDIYGNNLSLGQKQLITIARCLLDKKNIILVDEATANIDGPTEEKIKQIFESHFRDATVLTIAHKVTTIMQSQRILVIDDGEIVECDSPQKLLADPKSQFKQILDLVNKAEEL